MENMRTLAFQVPEDLFQRIKNYLRRNNMTQKQFVIGLIEDELERDETLLQNDSEEAHEVFSDEDSDVSADDFESEEDEDQSEEESEEKDHDYSLEM